jgi:predicted ArsR family transcriptional regulator
MPKIECPKQLRFADKQVMRLSIQPGDRQFMERLHEMGGGTVQEICAEQGVTATAVRHRLVRLQEAGFVARELVPSKRGRPHHVYRVTREALREMGNNYAELAQILWREIRNIEDPAVRRQLASRVEDALVDQIRKVSPNAPLNVRLAELAAELRERGFRVESDHSGLLPVLRENNCPYYELASEDPGICEMEQAVFRRALNADVRLTRCCLDGHSCCEFQTGEFQTGEPALASSASSSRGID